MNDENNWTGGSSIPNLNRQQQSAQGQGDTPLGQGTPNQGQPGANPGQTASNQGQNPYNPGQAGQGVPQPGQLQPRITGQITSIIYPATQANAGPSSANLTQPAGQSYRPPVTSASTTPVTQPGGVPATQPVTQQRPGSALNQTQPAQPVKRPVTQPGMPPVTQQIPTRPTISPGTQPVNQPNSMTNPTGSNSANTSRWQPPAKAAETKPQAEPVQASEAQTERIRKTQPWELSDSVVVTPKPLDYRGVVDPAPAETQATLVDRKPFNTPRPEHEKQPGYSNQGYASNAYPGSEPPAQTRQPKRKGRAGKVLALLTIMLLVLALGGTLGFFLPPYLKDHVTKQTKVKGQTPIVQVKGSETDWEAVAKAVRPAVVDIQVDLGNGTETGSGVIFDDKADVLTNNHVISKGNGKNITVHLIDGRIYQGKVIGTDPTTDLAVVRIVNPPKDLVKAPLGSSDKLQVGQPVAAIGTPLGLAFTMTTGIISALDRPVQVQTSPDYLEDPNAPQPELVITNAIQIDASINPGNSGGPLFDNTGQVIGINSSIVTLNTSADGKTGGSIGLGFAIPINLAKMVAKQLVEKGKADHAALGVYIGTGTAQSGSALVIGAKISQIVPNSAAQKAGLKVGDVVLAIDGKQVVSGPSLTGFIRRYLPGNEVTLKISRQGQIMDVKVKLGAKTQ